MSPILWLLLLLVGFVLVSALFEGVMLEWANWAFSRDENGRYSPPKRASQVFWYILWATVLVHIAYGVIVYL